MKNASRNRYADVFYYFHSEKCILPDLFVYIDYRDTWMGKTVQVYGFPSTVTADAVKSFLESHTGEGTIYAIKIRDTKKGGPRKYAIVQFMTVEDAEHIIFLTTKRLWYGTSYLKARPMDLDIVPKPRTFFHSMEHITLHFGNQLSKENFYVLWKGTDVLVNFGSGMRKLHFYLSHHGVEYKLDLSYESIWQIELHRPRGQSVKYLVIQVSSECFILGIIELFSFVL